MCVVVVQNWSKGEMVVMVKVLRWGLLKGEEGLRKRVMYECEWDRGGVFWCTKKGGWGGVLVSHRGSYGGRVRKMKKRGGCCQRKQEHDGGVMRWRLMEGWAHSETLKGVGGLWNGKRWGW